MRTAGPGFGSARSTRRAWIGLAGLVLLALILRWPATTRLLPHAPEPDAYPVQLAQDWRGDPALIRHTDYAERYPILVATLLQTLPWPAPDVEPGEPGARERFLRHGAGAYLAARWLVLALALLAIPGTWLAARRLAGERAAWIAAALVSTSMLHALFSTQARPHAVQAAIAVFAVWAAMRLAERADFARTVVAVLTSSLALASLQIGAATLPPLALAAWLAGGSTWKRVTRAAALPLLAVLAATWAYPFALARLEGGLRLGGKGAHEIDFAAADFSGFLLLARKLSEHDPTLAVLLAGAIASAVVRGRAVIAAARARPDVLVACGYALPYLLLVGSLNEVFERFLLPLLPWIATFAAALLVRLAGHHPRRVAFLGAAAAAVPLALLVHFARVCARPDSYRLARDWIESDAAAREATFVSSPGLVLPAPNDAASLAAAMDDPAGRATPWFAFQGTWPEAEFPRPRLALHVVPTRLAQRPAEGFDAWFARVSPRYVLLERTSRSHFLAGARALTAIAEERGSLVFHTEGEAPGIEERGLLHYQSMDGFVRRLLRTERFGPRIEVWRLGP